MKALVTGGGGFLGLAIVRALRKRGEEVRSFSRHAHDALQALGVEQLRGDIADPAAVSAAVRGCDIVYHVAAKPGIWGSYDEYHQPNVTGTQNVIDACRDAGVRRLVHVGTEAALMVGQPLINVDESAPLRPDSTALYSSSKAKAEQLVRDAGGLETVVVRPRFVWGRGDTSLLPTIIEMVTSGRFRWIGGGGQLSATTHIDNTVEGLWLAATKAPADSVYFVTDGEPVVFREFLTELLATQGVKVPDRSVPAGVARVAAAASERIWRLLKRPGPPPLTRFAVWVSSQECTIDISRAERELGYRPVISREAGLAELRS